MAETTQKTQPVSLPERLDYAIYLAKAGQKETARDILRQIVALQPVNQAAWLWLSAVAPDQSEAEAALTQARHINPAHDAMPKAEQWLAKRFSSQPKTKVTPVLPSGARPTQPVESASGQALSWFKRPSTKLLNTIAMSIVLAALFIGLVVLCFGVFWEVTATAQASPTTKAELWPEAELTNAALDEAWQAQRWSKVITLLEGAVSEAEPDLPGRRKQLTQAYVYRGLILRQDGLIEEAKAQFEKALALDSRLELAQVEAELALDYLQGKSHHQNGDWSAAITVLEKIYAQNSSYPTVKDLLFSAYYNQGLTLQATEKFSAARKALEAAIALHPDLAEPRLRLAELDFAQTAETPPAIPLRSVPIEDRLVLVGIAEQRMHVYEGDKLVYDFIVSTGEPGRDTAIGEFEIQNKIDVAYASTWNLDMPNWMGIYWAGPLQNGIHSLPTVRHTGQTLWDGYLGQRVSYGCVILGHGDSATLFDWAEVGTKVKIVPSLAAWQPDS